MQESLSTLADLLTRPEFMTGLICGAIALIILFGLSLVAEARFATWGVLLSAAVFAGIQIHIGRRISLVIALTVLAAGGLLLDMARERRLVALAGWGMVGVGALLFSSRSGLPQIEWVRVVAPAVAIVGGLALRSWQGLGSRRLLGAMFAITAFGIWTTVPATASARILLGAAIPMAAGTIGIFRGRISGPGAFALAGIAVWVVALGGEPRPASMIGGWASLGLILAVPLIPERLTAGVRSWALLAGHALVVLVASRVVGLQESITAALVGLTGLLAVVLVAIALMSRRRVTTPAAADGT